MSENNLRRYSATPLSLKRRGLRRLSSEGIRFCCCCFPKYNLKQSFYYLSSSFALFLVSYESSFYSSLCLSLSLSLPLSLFLCRGQRRMFFFGKARNQAPGTQLLFPLSAPRDARAIRWRVRQPGVTVFSGSCPTVEV